MMTHFKKMMPVALALLCMHPLFPFEGGGVVESISVYGNRKAKRAMITRVISLKEGQPFTPEALEQSKKRLETLGIFKLVDMETRKGDEGIIVIINVQEKKPFYYGPALRFNGDAQHSYDYSEEAERNSFGLAVGLNDLSGKRQTLELTAGAGGLRRVGLAYSKEYFSNFSWGIKLENLWYKTRLYDAQMEKFNARFFIRQRLSNLSLRFWGGYDTLKAVVNSLILLAPYPDKRFRLGMDVTYDSRNPGLFPSRGVAAKLGSYKVLDTGGKRVYDRYKLELAGFFKVFKKSVLALDVKALFSDGDVLFDERIYFGGYRTLRGRPVGYSGNHAVVMSGEYRIPFGGLGRGRGSSKFLGASVYLFADFGILSEKIKELNLDDIKYNTGFGFTWAIRQQSILRLDLSVFPKVRLTVGTGWKF
ncbi:MAG: BamA/TamA family outer membrane protein [bacterium]|nr:BamA/TamA family outer membrane protein [bacterium]